MFVGEKLSALLQLTFSHHLRQHDDGSARVPSTRDVYHLNSKCTGIRWPLVGLPSTQGYLQCVPFAPTERHSRPQASGGDLLARVLLRRRQIRMLYERD